MDKNKKLLIIIATLVVLIAGVSFLAFNEFRKNKNMTELLPSKRKRWKMNTVHSPLSTMNCKFR